MEHSVNFAEVQYSLRVVIQFHIFIWSKLIASVVYVLFMANPQWFHSMYYNAAKIILNPCVEGAVDTNKIGTYDNLLSV